MPTAPLLRSARRRSAPYSQAGQDRWHRAVSEPSAGCGRYFYLAAIAQAMQHVFDHCRSRRVKPRKVLLARDSPAQPGKRRHHERLMVTCHYGIKERDVSDLPSRRSNLVKVTTYRSATVVRYRPVVGQKPTIPNNAAGTRTDPWVSSATPSGAMPAATAAAVPPLLPPGIRDASQGLRTGP